MAGQIFSSWRWGPKAFTAQVCPPTPGGWGRGVGHPLGTIKTAPQCRVSTMPGDRESRISAWDREWNRGNCVSNQQVERQCWQCFLGVPWSGEPQPRVSLIRTPTKVCFWGKWFVLLEDSSSTYGRMSLKKTPLENAYVRWSKVGMSFPVDKDLHRHGAKGYCRLTNPRPISKWL